MGRIRCGATMRGELTKGDGDSWAHNCPATPRFVIIQPLDEFFMWYLDLDGTNITLHTDAATDVKFKYAAFYDEDDV